MKTVLIFGLLAWNLHIHAMTTVAQNAASTTQEEIILLLGESQEPIKIPRHHALLIQGCRTLVEMDLDTLDLPRVSKKIGELIAQQLGNVYIHTKQDDSAIIEEIKRGLQDLDGDTLVEFLQAVDYLDIPILAKIAHEMVRKLTPDKISTQNIKALPSQLSTSLVNDQVSKLATLLNKETLSIRTVAQWQAHKDVSQVCVTHDNKIVTRSSDNRTIRIWNMEGMLIAECLHSTDIESMCVTSDNNIVVACTASLDIWDTQGHNIFSKATPGLSSICAGPDNKIVMGFYDGLVRIWKIGATDGIICQGGRVQAIICVQCTGDNRIVAYTLDGTIHIWDIQGQLLAEDTSSKHISAMGIMNDGKVVTAAVDYNIIEYSKIVTTAHGVTIWNTLDNKRSKGNAPPEGCSINSIVTTNDGIIVSAAHRGELCFWDASATLLASKRKSSISSLHVFNNKIVIGSLDGTLSILDTSGTQLGCTHHGAGISVIGTIDGDTVVLGLSNGKIVICKIETAHILQNIASLDQDHIEEIWGVLQKYTARKINPQQCWDRSVSIVQGTCSNAELTTSFVFGVADWFLGHTGSL